MSVFKVLDQNNGLVITACVGFVKVVDTDKYVLVKNYRGWDIPGGHVENNETLFQTFERELLEETGCNLLPGAIQIAVLESVKREGTGISVFLGYCEIGKFEPNTEIEAIKFVTKREMLELYHGDKEILRKLLKICETLD